MRLFRLHGISIVLALTLALGFTVAMNQPSAYSQETTGGLQGTVKDPSGAVVPGAKVVLTGTSLLGNKVVITDASG